MDKSDLVTFMKNSVAKLCESEPFRDFITDVLVKKYGMDADQIAMSVKESFAKRCIEADFVLLVDRVFSANILETMIFLFSQNIHQTSSRFVFYGCCGVHKH